MFFDCDCRCRDTGPVPGPCRRPERPGERTSRLPVAIFRRGCETTHQEVETMRCDHLAAGYCCGEFAAPKTEDERLHHGGVDGGDGH